MTNSQQRVYPIWRPLRYGMIAGGAFLAAYALLAVYTTYPAPAVAYLGLFALLFAPGVLVMLHALRSHIVTSPSGLAYHSLLYTISATWANTERIAQNRRKRFVLYLRESSYAGPRWLQPVLRGTGRDRAITLSLHIPNYRLGEFAADLRRYAPHLLEPQATVGEDDGDRELEIY